MNLQQLWTSVFWLLFCCCSGASLLNTFLSVRGPALPPECHPTPPHQGVFAWLLCVLVEDLWRTRRRTIRWCTVCMLVDRTPVDSGGLDVNAQLITAMHWTAHICNRTEWRPDFIALISFYRKKKKKSPGACPEAGRSSICGVTVVAPTTENNNLLWNYCSLLKSHSEKVLDVLLLGMKTHLRVCNSWPWSSCILTACSD